MLPALAPHALVGDIIRNPPLLAAEAKVGIVGGAPEPPGPAGTAGDAHVLTHASTAATCPGTLFQTYL